MRTIVYCMSCHGHFMDNSEKHRYRPKLCPYCRAPYTSGSIWTRGLRLPNPKRTLQKVFSFFTSRKGKDIHYFCPKCGLHAYSESDMRIQKVPDKTKTVMVNGQPQIVPVTYRSIPTCRNCNSFLVRKKVEV